MENMIDVTSSNIKKIGWKEEKLYVEYSSGIYEYDDVPKEVFESFKLAKSKGTFMNEYIKNNYSYRRV